MKIDETYDLADKLEEKYGRDWLFAVVLNFANVEEAANVLGKALESEMLPNNWLRVRYKDDLIDVHVVNPLGRHYLFTVTLFDFGEPW